MSRQMYTAGRGGGGVVSPLSSPIPEIKGWEQRPRQTEDLAVFTSWKLPARACSKVCLSLYSSTSGLRAQEQLLPGPERMARATRYLYNKKNREIMSGCVALRHRGPFAEWSRSASERERGEKEREREDARELFSFYAIEGWSPTVTWHVGGCENLIALDRTTWIRLSVSRPRCRGRLFA